MSLAEPEKIFELKKDDVVEFDIESGFFSFKIMQIDPVVKINDSKNRDYFLVQNYRKNIDVNDDKKDDIQINLNPGPLKSQLKFL